MSNGSTLSNIKSNGIKHPTCKTIKRSRSNKYLPLNGPSLYLGANHNKLIKKSAIWGITKLNVLIKAVFTSLTPTNTHATTPAKKIQAISEYLT
jgi:hypothetical protein